MDINKKIDIFSQQIQEIVNKSELPIGIVFYIIKDLYREIEYTYISYLNNLAFQAEEETQEEQ